MSPSSSTPFCPCRESGHRRPPSTNARLRAVPGVGGGEGRILAAGLIPHLHLDLSVGGQIEIESGLRCRPFGIQSGARAVHGTEPERQSPLNGVCSRRNPGGDIISVAIQLEGLCLLITRRQFLADWHSPRAAGRNRSSLVWLTAWITSNQMLVWLLYSNHRISRFRGNERPAAVTQLRAERRFHVANECGA